jgi:hypothetical protein
VTTPHGSPPLKSLDHSWQAFMSHLLGSYVQLVPRNRILSRATRRLVGLR